MPPRHAYWTIIVDEQPTSFRAHDVEELLPTFNRLREKHPNAQLKWFERGQLWESRDAAREHGLGKGERRWEGARPSREEGGGEPTRDAKWRPGGEHRDPRQKYKDAKKTKWDSYKQKIRARWEEKQGPRPDDGEYTPPHGDPMRPKVRDRGDARPEWRQGDRHGETRSRPPRRDGERREWQARPEKRREERREQWQPREEHRRDDRREDRRPREEHRRDDRREEWRAREDRPKRPWGNKPGGGARKPWSGKPGSGAAQKTWGDRPAGRDRGETWKGKPSGADARKSWGGKAPGADARKTWGGKPSAGGAGKTWGGKASGGGARKSWGGKPGAGGFRKKPFGSGPPRGPRDPKKRREDEE